MTSDFLSKTLDKTHHPVLCSYFRSSDEARLAVVALMSEGLSEQDLALLVLAAEAGQTKIDPLEYVVAPVSSGQSNQSDETNGSFARESEVGGGIATSTPDDDVSATQEMDDSESVAQDQAYPGQGHSLEEEEAIGAGIATHNGFVQAVIPGDNRLQVAESTLESVNLPGLGELIGEGSFGTILLDKVFKEGDTSLAWLAARLNRKDGETGVTIGKSGALLAVDVNASSPNPDRIEELLLDNRAAWVRSA